MESWDPNQEVRVGLMPIPPGVSSCSIAGGNVSLCAKPGFMVEVIQTACEFLRLRCALSLVNHTDYGDKLSGEWRGMVREVADGVFHTSQPAFSLTQARLDVIDFSTPVVPEALNYITRFPAEPDFVMYEVKAFGTDVWLCILAAMLAIAVLGAGSERLLGSVRSSRLAPRSLWRLGARIGTDAVQLFLKQGHSELYQDPTLLLFLFWGLCVTVITGTYASFIVVQVLAKNVHPPFTSISELAACISSKKCTLVDYTTSRSDYTRIVTATSGDFLLLRRALEANPVRVVPAPEIPTAMVSGAPKFAVATGTEAAFALASQELPECSLIKLHVMADPFHFIFAKNSSLLPLFNRAVVRMDDSGILARIRQAYLHGADKNRESRCTGNRVESNPMGLRNFYGAYAGLGIERIKGIVLAVCVLGWEALLAWKGRIKAALISAERRSFICLDIWSRRRCEAANAGPAAPASPSTRTSTSSASATTTASNRLSNSATSLRIVNEACCCSCN